MTDGHARKLTELLEVAQFDVVRDVLVRHGAPGLSDPARAAAVDLLAHDAMLVRCGDTALLALWRQRRDGEDTSPGRSRLAALASYAGIGFGTPGAPANDEHIQGLVAELIWSRLTRELQPCTDGRVLRVLHGAKPDPLEPGGDGLAVYERPDRNDLVFRLWEVKKHGGARPISRTIRKASEQLATRGTEYLAKLAGPETLEQPGIDGALYGNMVESWLDRSDRAGVGVAIGGSADRIAIKRRSFRSLVEQFGEFADPGQREGLVVAIPDFPRFSSDVRAAVWSGL